MYGYVCIFYLKLCCDVILMKDLWLIVLKEIVFFVLINMFVLFLGW